MKLPYLNFLPAALLAALLAGCGGSDEPAADVQTPPDDGSADVARGMAELERQDYRAAVAAFDTAARACETNLEARMQLSLAHLRLQEVDAAHAAATNAVAVDATSAEARLLAGQTALLKRDSRRALAEFAAVISEPSLSAALRSDAYVGRGVVELRQNAYDAAFVSFLRARRLNSRNAAAWYHLGYLCRNTYHFEEAAVELFAMAANFMAPDDPRKKKIAGDILPALKASVEAAAASRPGVAKRDPAQAAKLLAEGESLQKKKMIRAAIKKYEAAYAADPLSDVAALKYATLVALNDKTPAGVDKALGAYGAVISQRPARQANYLAAARLAYENKRWATAATFMYHAIAHDPENRQALDMLIASLQKAGKAKQAEGWKAYRTEVR